MPPVPPWTHREHIFSYVTGAALLVLGISLLINKEARLSATILGLLSCVHRSLSARRETFFRNHSRR
jgi:hypothetical protein